MGVTEDNWHSVRAEIAHQHIRGLLMINGGAAVALLAFLQAIWETDKSLSKYVVVGIIILLIGIAMAGLSNWLRYQTSVRYQSKAPHRRYWSRISNAIQILPLFCFLFAVLVVSYGVLHLSSDHSQASKGDSHQAKLEKN